MRKSHSASVIPLPLIFIPAQAGISILN